MLAWAQFHVAAKRAENRVVQMGRFGIDGVTLAGQIRAKRQSRRTPFTFCWTAAGDAVVKLLRARAVV